MSDERDRPEGGAEEEELPGDDASEEGEERPTVAPPFDPVAFAKAVLHGAAQPSGPPSPGDEAAAEERLPGSASVSSAPPPSQRPPPRQGGLSVPPPSPALSLDGPFSPGALQGPASMPQSPGSSNAHTRVTPPGGFRPQAPTFTDSEALEEARKKSLEIIHGRSTPTGALSYVNTTIPSNLPPAPGSGAPGSSPPRTESISGLNAVDAEWAELEVATRPPPPGQNPEDFDIPSRREPPFGVVLPTEREEPPPSGKKTAPPPAPAADPAFLERAKKKSVREDLPPTEEEMNERVALGDYTGALSIAEKLLVEDPANEAVASVAENCRTVLRQMYVTKIGPMDRVPMVMVPRDQLRWLSIDHRAGFVLSLVDGVSSLEMILDVSGMPDLDTLRILTELAQQRIISFR